MFTSWLFNVAVFPFAPGLLFSSGEPFRCACPLPSVLKWGWEPVKRPIKFASPIRKPSVLLIYIRGTSPRPADVKKLPAFRTHDRQVSFGSILCHFGCDSFDSTFGFPGEGPHNSCFTLCSANIGSVTTNHDWKSWGANLLCLQETRIGKNNCKSAKFSFRDAGYEAILGDLLPGLLHKVGRQHAPCGGTAILAPPGFIKPFVESDDATGLFQMHFRTRRVSGAWVQIAPKRKLLVFSIYATTSASNDPKIHETNDKLFNDLFQICAQFGSIPIVLAGDFQAFPLSYPAISSAVHFHGWHDPLLGADDSGDITRPYTFSNDGLFSGQGEGCTSIDGILMNSSAFFALEDCQVATVFGRQHRPIRCSFNWETLEQVGYVHYRSAPLDVSNVPKPQENARNFDDLGEIFPPVPSSWDLYWENDFHATSDPDTKWKIINEFCVHTLVASGATWGEGPHERAQPPQFIPKKDCPPQHTNNCAATRHSAQLHKLLNRLDEIALRRARAFGSAADYHVFRTTIHKIQRGFSSLKLPLDWPDQDEVTLVHIQAARNLVTQLLATHYRNLKAKRIGSWKARIKHSAASGSSYIFQHLKNKLQDEPSNLVEDDDGNILYQPDKALAHLNNKWDDVYSSNVLHDHPLQMLNVVWPYIKDKINSIDLPPVTPIQLFRTIQKRKPKAAPGLDGWRTQELQKLPLACFVPIARFFQWIEHDPSIDLPKTLTCAKQIILNKPGPSSAMNKRLISILPALLLAYTGSRYEQLQSWQLDTMPSCIIGGIRGRTMPSLHTALRLELDIAKVDNDDLVGVKLDKAKCFDRILPTHTCALFLAFGLPKSFVSFYLRIYQGLHRHMAYKGWVSPIATTAPNGVVQGCSLSLLAINVHTKVWVHLLELLPGLSMRAYVDDAYIWCKLHNIAVLTQAVQVTRHWDELIGQKLNDNKSTIWGTSTKARKAIAQALPEMKLALVFDALGARIYTSNKDDFQFAASTLEQACNAVECIGALPIPVHVRSQLVGAKAIAKLTYTTHISKTPKAALTKIQNCVAKALWRDRPGIRSKHLVLLFFGKPWRVDPFIAVAYNCLLDVFRYCFEIQDAYHKLRYSAQHGSHNKNSVAALVRKACETLFIEVTDDLDLCIHNSPPIRFGSVCPKDFAKVLQALACQAQYRSIAARKRKDICKPGGLIDMHLSTLFLKRPTFETPAFPTATMHFESVLVGCTLTKDRLCASGWADDSLCRFCAAKKETMPHLLFECKTYAALTSSPNLHEFGGNFPMLGIYEHPEAIAAKRLRQIDIQDIAPQEFIPDQPVLEFWTDGSVLWPKQFWITSAAYAIISQSGSVVESGPVFALALSSYVPELWAIWRTFAQASQAIRVFTDNQAVARNFQYMFRHNKIQKSWSCWHWWKVIWRTWSERCEICAQPLDVIWIPAHLLEEFPDFAISDTLAQTVGSTRKNILHNRWADREAKLQAYKYSLVRPETQRLVEPATLAHQEWLTKLHVHLATHEVAKPAFQDTASAAVIDTDALTLDNAPEFFPKWAWDAPAALFPWKPKIPSDLPPPAKWKHSLHDWRQIVTFLSQLRWRTAPHASAAFCELALQMHAQGYELEKHADLTIHDLLTRVRQCLQFLVKDPTCQACPGSLVPGHAKSEGRVLCQGAVVGAVPCFSNRCLFLLAQAVGTGAGRTTQSWAVPLSCLHV